MIFSRFASDLLALAPAVLAASLQQVPNFGYNPTNIQMYIYVPDKTATEPPIVVALHPCGGSAQSFFSGTTLPKAADKLGFILIYPSTTKYDHCWDVNNPASLRHNGGGDAGGIVSMVNYTLTKARADPYSVFVMGASSGAMMTNVLAGSYPDVFAGGASYSGVPFGCLIGSTGEPTPSGSNQSCASGAITHSPAQWASFVRNAYPGYAGRRPSMLIAHGLADGLVRPANAYAQLAQWSAVLGLVKTNDTPANTDEGSDYEEITYGNGSQLVGYLGKAVGHWAPTNTPALLKFWKLDKPLD
ncbi:hypothetical protein P8C59_007500 [Phyllachora maydis]|uniref:Carboxylic ester hydrolase n=1 Tax=Phyllachora maydis TaxID=1825666 RepID=A0AAD9MEA1_9PEZI|nr:hypothetical protein P8C59_007500 [Phyllachora maydis]